MSEIRTAKERAEITVRNLKTRKVTIHTGRFGVFFECYAYCVAQGYELLQYTALA